MISSAGGICVGTFAYFLGFAHETLVPYAAWAERTRECSVGARFVPQTPDSKGDNVGIGCCRVRLVSRIRTSKETGGRRSQIFYRMRKFIDSREAILHLSDRRGPRPFYGNRRRSSNKRAQKVRNISATRATSTEPDGTKLAGLPKPRALYSISKRIASRLSLPDSSSSVSPAWSKHRRQSPLFMRTAASHCGHSSSSCVIAGSK